MHSVQIFELVQALFEEEELTSKIRAEKGNKPTLESINPNNDTARSVKLQSRFLRLPKPFGVGTRMTTGKKTARGFKKPDINPPPSVFPWSLVRRPRPPWISSSSASAVELEALAFPLSILFLSNDSGKTNSSSMKLTNEQATATQKTVVTTFSLFSSIVARNGCWMSHPPMLGPTKAPREKAPVKRLKMGAREPGEVQSLR
jgi:hypothetical protein